MNYQLSHVFPLVLIGWASTASAATWVVPVHGSRELTLALPPAQAPGGESASASSVSEIVRHDLDLTGYFQLIESSSDAGGVEPGSFDWATWRSRGAAAMARMRVLPGGTAGCDAPRGGLCADVYIYDVLGEGKLAGKRIRGGPGELRMVAHEVSNQVLLALVGEPGFFAGQIVAVRQGSADSKEIVLLDIDGENIRPVTRNGSVNLSPGWSPDGTRVVWTSFKRGDADIFVKDMRNGGVRTVSGRVGAELSPAFSPDGRYIAVARAEGAETDIWLLDASTGAPIRQLTSGGGIDVSPCFTPNGDTIVFSSERGGTPSIYAVSTDGGTPWRVTPFAGRFTDPMVSPDGRRVAFVIQHGAFDIWAANMDGSGLTKVTSGVGDNEDPSWSPDGRYLAFTSTRRGRSEIWLATENGRFQAPLTSTGGWSQPVWRP